MTGRGARLLAVFVVLAATTAGAAPLEVAIVAPDPGQTVFGAVVIEAETYPRGSPVARLEAYVDGLLVATREAPPWRFEVDVGEANDEHVFEVVAYPPGEGAAPVTARLRTPALLTHLEVDADLQQLYVTVLEDGQRVGDLGRDAFTIRDVGSEQQLVTFERGDVPFTAVLMVDASQSMASGGLGTALGAVRRFAVAMGPLDEAKLMLFSDRILYESPSTSIVSLLTLGLKGVEAEGGTALNDALYAALKALETRQGRRVIVVLSDGIDVDSVLEMSDVRAVARRSDAAIYWIRTLEGNLPAGARWTSAWRDSDGHARALDDLGGAVADTGGRIFTVVDLPAVDAAFSQLLDELRGQYVLGYYPRRSLGAGTWRPIAIEVARRGVSVRTRAGYVED